MESVAWLRANRAESVKMIVDKFKVNQQEAEDTYATLIKILNKDGRLNPKVARGYLDILRQERSIPADYDPMKHTDFSLAAAQLMRECRAQSTAWHRAGRASAAKPSKASALGAAPVTRSGAPTPVSAKHGSANVNERIVGFDIAAACVTIADRIAMALD